MGDAPEGGGFPGTEKPASKYAPAAAIDASPVVASDSRIVVPSIVGLRVDDALTRLERIGLSVGNMQKQTTAARLDDHRTAPSAGARVSPGAAVDLVVTEPAAKPATIRVRCPLRRAQSDREGRRGARPYGTHDRTSARSCGASWPHRGQRHRAGKRHNAGG